MEYDLLPKAFYKVLVEKLKNEPVQKTFYKQNFLDILDHILTSLIVNEKDYDKIFYFFKESQELFGEDDPDLLNVLGVALNRLDKPLEALNFLRLAVQKCPDNLRFFANQESIINQWVPRWHFTMLNDSVRNIAFKNAIHKRINKDKCKTVLDIGTGTGLLSVYCHQAGAVKIYACEIDEIMAGIAEEIFNFNMMTVKLLKCHSTDIVPTKIGVPRKFDLIVTEVFDSGAFGEDVLSTLIHAKENLLTLKGHILPEKIKIYVVGVDRIGISEKLNDIESSLENSIYLKDTIITAENENDPYQPIEQVGSKIVLCTEPVHAITVDFNDLNCLKSAIDGRLDCDVKLRSLDDGNLEGFFVYFELCVDDVETLTNFNSNVRSDHFQCWDPIVFPLNLPTEIRKYQIFNVHLSCLNGVLKLTHQYDNISKRHLKIPKEVFEYLTDDEFIHELEFNVDKSLKKRSLENFADFLPFPHIGINLLKESKILKLYCSSSVRDIVLKIANWNCIPESAIQFIDDFEYFDKDPNTTFDIILLQPITRHGELNYMHLKYYDLLKTKYLNINGVIFPAKIDICFKIIQSNWLENVTRIKNEELKAIGIQEKVNLYGTKHQYEYIDFDTIDLSEIFTQHIQFDVKMHKKHFVINLNTSNEANPANDDNAAAISKNFPVIGILYFYKIFFMNNSIPIATNRKKSFSKPNCFVQNYDITGKSNISIDFIQNDLAFYCRITDENK